jgi:hypothetical protein
MSKGRLLNIQDVIYTHSSRGLDARALPATNRAAMHGVIWYESDSVCAVANAERHLGHVVVTAEGWIAYDGTHSNPAGDGFNELGCFGDVMEAKAAVEEALGFRREPWERQSGATLLAM